MTRDRRRLTRLVLLAGVVQAAVVVAVLQRRGDDLGHAGEATYVGPLGHWLRDAVLYAPVGVALLLLATLLAHRLADRWTTASDGFAATLLWAGLGAVGYAVASVPASLAHGVLFAVGHAEPPSVWDAGQQAVLTLRYSFALLVAFAMVIGLPWAPRRRAGAHAAGSRPTPAPTLGDRSC